MTSASFSDAGCGIIVRSSGAVGGTGTSPSIDTQHWPVEYSRRSRSLVTEFVSVALHARFGVTPRSWRS